jgi:thiamine kinase-like enzyme
MCNAATVTVQTTEDTYDSYCEAYHEYDKEELEKVILDHIFDGHFWSQVSKYITTLDISPEAKNVLFGILKDQTVICVSAPELT